MNEEIICFNLVDFKVSWHRMSSNDTIGYKQENIFK